MDEAKPKTLESSGLQPVQLRDAIWAEQGQVLLSGTQALIRLMCMQRLRDHARGWNTRGYLTGYRGSPLGMVDHTAWKQGDALAKAGVHFVPALNEELAATQLLGTQRVETDPERTVDAVFGLWYGKGPGVDRAGDALKHGNAFGSSPHGGVLVVAGDDHGCVSSSMPHQSEGVFQAWSMPVLAPADVSEIILFGLYGLALSRYSGAWVGLAAPSEVVESTATVNLDAITLQSQGWHEALAVQAQTGHRLPVDGVHYRWPDLPSLRIESRLHDKLEAVAAFVQVNSIDRMVVDSGNAQVGIVTAGKAHHDLMEVMRRLGLSEEHLMQAGVRWIKLGLTYPIDAAGVRRFACGLREILVVEEKAPVVERQLQALFYNDEPQTRPAIWGKRDRHGQPLVPDLGELRPSRLMTGVARWLQECLGQSLPLPIECMNDFLPLAPLSNEADGMVRKPYFCAGCPHNTSTRVPEGATARAGIGCHFMANWMERSTQGLIQMGGEGVDWIAQAPFTRTPHVFQNLGDGTYSHSGLLAIRQAVATGTRITYKILYNDAVAMTGGQPVDSAIAVDAMARQLEAEGVTALAVVSDDIGKYAGLKDRFPKKTRFDDRSMLDAVQRALSQTDGVSVLIYEQTCAAEKRRRRKRGAMAEPERRVLIHEAVCEGCGDCGVQSNCVAVLPHETPWGRKRRIDQTHCNKDETCVQGFCPSFVSVVGGRLRPAAGASAEHRQRLLAQASALPQPQAELHDAPWDLLVTGVGGTGVVTVGAVIAMAAHLQGWRASVLDFMGFAQKGGAVLSFVRLAAHERWLHQARIDAQQADAVLACDAVVAAAPEALQTLRQGRTRVVANTHVTPLPDTVTNPDAQMPLTAVLDKLRHAAGDAQMDTLDAQTLCAQVLGSTLAANVLAMGYAWQKGLIPVRLDAMEQAIGLNGVAVDENLLAFAVGRLAAEGARSSALAIAQGQGDTAGMTATTSLQDFVAQAQTQLQDWQDEAWSARYRALLDEVRQLCERHGPKSPDAREALVMCVARSLHKLMSYKDEYEVARLLSDPEFHRRLQTQFEGAYKLVFHMAPPVLERWLRVDGQPRKIAIGQWVLPWLRWLAHGKRWRGTFLDVFGRSAHRRMERALIDDYVALFREVLPLWQASHHDVVRELLSLPMRVRGYGHIKERQAQAAQTRRAWLLHRLEPTCYPKPALQQGLHGVAVILDRS